MTRAHLQVPVEKIVEVFVDVPCERIVEKIVEVPVERVVIKEVPIEVVKEVIVEKIIEVRNPVDMSGCARAVCGECDGGRATILHCSSIYVVNEK